MIITITPLPSWLILFITQELTMHAPVTKTSTMTTLLFNNISLVLDVWFGPLFLALTTIFTFTLFTTLHFLNCVDFRHFFLDFTTFLLDNIQGFTFIGQICPTLFNNFFQCHCVPLFTFIFSTLHGYLSH
uniref:Uncharacterized protein n=1 Tax=Meloidogyne incognita TaxID=6306 RepID=A0A914NN13_MELIC